MKTDLYTKVLLTIIAFCLSFNVLKDLDIIQTAKAETPIPAPEVNHTNREVIDVNIVKIDGKSVTSSARYSGILPVKLSD